jgi:transcriptional regulator with XRE-family HTH domain
MKNLDFSHIGKKIKELRISKGLTQEYIANMADVNTSHISNIENNRVKISLSTLVQVCNALDVTVDYILADEYITPDTALDESIMKALKSCDVETKERILKIIQILQ